MVPKGSIIPAHPRKPPGSVGLISARWTQRPTSHISDERISDLIEAARAIEEQDPWSAESIRYAGRCFVQANLPHSLDKATQFETFVRKNGNMRLEVKPSAKYGMPYGTLPRIIMLWVADEARRTKNPTIFLGDNLSRFMAELDVVPTGGKWGTVTRLRDQMRRLFNADIRFTDITSTGEQGKLFAIEDYKLWWDRPVDPSQSDLWRSQITLTGPLFEELLVHSSPVDMRAIRVLRKSPMSLDIYCWLNYRMLTLNRPLFLSYDILQMQFGANYGRTRDFKSRLNRALWTVLKLYPACRVETDVEERGTMGWKLEPSVTHVPRLLAPKKTPVRSAKSARSNKNKK